MRTGQEAGTELWVPVFRGGKMTGTERGRSGNIEKVEPWAPGQDGWAESVGARFLGLGSWSVCLWGPPVVAAE